MGWTYWVSIAPNEIGNHNHDIKMSWFTISLLCAFSLGSADAFTKRYLHGYTGAELVIVRFTFAGVLLLPLLFRHPLPMLPAPFWGWLAILVPLEILAMWLYMVAIRDSPLSLTLPYLSFTPVFATLSGFLVLGEHISGQAFLGIVFVAAGAYVLNVERGPWKQARAWIAPLKAILTESGSRYMLGAAALYSVTSVVGKKAMQLTSPVFFGSAYFIILSLAAMSLFTIKNPRVLRVLWKRPSMHFLIGSMMAIMVITHFIAIDQAQVAYIIAVKRTSMFVGVMYGVFFFGEKHVLQHVVGTLLMLAGITIIVI